MPRTCLSIGYHIEKNSCLLSSAHQETEISRFIVLYGFFCVFCVLKSRVIFCARKSIMADKQPLVCMWWRDITVAFLLLYVQKITVVSAFYTTMRIGWYAGISCLNVGANPRVRQASNSISPYVHVRTSGEIK